MTETAILIVLMCCVSMQCVAEDLMLKPVTIHQMTQIRMAMMVVVMETVEMSLIVKSMELIRTTDSVNRAKNTTSPDLLPMTVRCAPIKVRIQMETDLSDVRTMSAHMTQAAHLHQHRVEMVPVMPEKMAFPVLLTVKSVEIV